METHQRVAIVTGGSRGIGRAIVQRLSEDGFRVYFTYSQGETAAAEVEKTAPMAKGYRVDVRDSEACKAFVAMIKEKEGKVDALVNNAGITKDGLLIRMTDEQFESVQEVNCKGAFYMLRECAGVMLRAKRGSIVNISSVSGVLGNAGQVNYSAAKAGMIGMTKAAALELAPRNIRVNAVAPGVIQTDMIEAMPEEAREKLLSGVPLKRAGMPQEVAALVAFLVGEESRYMTGQVLSLDGGLTA